MLISLYPSTETDFRETKKLGKYCRGEEGEDPEGWCVGLCAVHPPAIAVYSDDVMMSRGNCCDLAAAATQC